MGLKPSGLRGSLRNVSVGVPAIPDSAVLHYSILERSDNTIVEELTENDATAEGTSNDSGDWFKGYSESNQNEDYIDIPTEGLDFWSENLNSDWALIFTVETTETSGVLAGFEDTSNSESFQVTISEFGAVPDDKLGFYLRDDAGADLIVHSNSDVNTGDKIRAIIQYIADSDDIEMYFNNTDETNVTNDESPDFTTAFSDLYSTFAVFARQDGDGITNHSTGSVDNIIFCDDSLGEDERESDLNAQPWY